jgi:hypothetical protein
LARTATILTAVFLDVRLQVEADLQGEEQEQRPDREPSAMAATPPMRTVTCSTITRT